MAEQFEHKELFCFVGRHESVLAVENTEAGTFHSVIIDNKTDEWRALKDHANKRDAIRAVPERRNEV